MAATIGTVGTPVSATACSCGTNRVLTISCWQTCEYLCWCWHRGVLVVECTCSTERVVLVVVCAELQTQAHIHTISVLLRLVSDLCNTNSWLQTACTLTSPYALHTLRASVCVYCRGCRNTVFNASAQSGLYYLPRLAAAGFGTLRIELVNEPEDFVRPLLETYRRVLQGRMKPRDAWRWLQDNCAGGVAAGSLDVKGERAVSSLRPSARRT